MEQEQADTLCIPSARKWEKWQIFHSGPQRRARGLYCCLLRARPTGPSQPLAGLAMPCPSQGIDGALVPRSQSQPLQKHGIVAMLLPVRSVQHLRAPTSRGLLRKWLRFGPIFAVKQGTRAVLPEKAGLGSASSLQQDCTHRMRICKLESRQF